MVGRRYYTRKEGDELVIHDSIYGKDYNIEEVEVLLNRQQETIHKLTIEYMSIKKECDDYKKKLLEILWRSEYD